MKISNKYYEYSKIKIQSLIIQIEIKDLIFLFIFFKGLFYRFKQRNKENMIFFRLIYIDKIFNLIK